MVLRFGRVFRMAFWFSFLHSNKGRDGAEELEGVCEEEVFDVGVTKGDGGGFRRVDGESRR